MCVDGRLTDGRTRRLAYDLSSESPKEGHGPLDTLARYSPFENRLRRGATAQVMRTLQPFIHLDRGTESLRQENDHKEINRSYDLN